MREIPLKMSHEQKMPLMTRSNRHTQKKKGGDIEFCVITTFHLYNLHSPVSRTTKPCRDYEDKTMKNRVQTEKTKPRK